MESRACLSALRLIERARRKPETAEYLRARAVQIVGGDVEAIDLDRALDLIRMGPDRYFRHEQAVAAILDAVGAPVRARLIKSTREIESAPRALTNSESASKSLARAAL